MATHEPTLDQLIDGLIAIKDREAANDPEIGRRIVVISPRSGRSYDEPVDYRIAIDLTDTLEAPSPGTTMTRSFDDFVIGRA